MKRLAKSCPAWLEILERLRNLCQFFRNKTWREWVARALKSQIPDIAYELKYFTASFAKWRFETIVDTLFQLRPLRQICELLRPEMFANAQEKKFVLDVGGVP